MESYNYKFPADLIAKKPANPRDSARILVYQKSKNRIFYGQFKNIIKYLPKNAVLVFNETKVLPAKLILKKETGGSVQILYFDKDGEHIKVMSNRRLLIGKKVYLNSKIFFTVSKIDGRYYLLKPNFPIKDLYKILEKYGLTPLPPYIKNSPLSEKKLKQEYQAVFAKNKGSIAAPTASLHFTKKLLQVIKKSGRSACFITLHVNLGTFLPVTDEQIKLLKLHKENYEISKATAEFLNQAKKEKRPIIAVGTTVVRALESAADSRGIIKNLKGTTDLFIKEKYKFKFVNGIITNFHVPKSSLLMLVSAFISRNKILELYQKAIQKKFRLFSFGDGMLIY